MPSAKIAVMKLLKDPDGEIGFGEKIMKRMEMHRMNKEKGL